MSQHSLPSTLLAVFLVLTLQSPTYGALLCGLHGSGDMDHMPAHAQLVDGHGSMGECHLMGGCTTSNVGPVSVEVEDDGVAVTGIGFQPGASHDSQDSSSPRPPPPKA